MAPEGGTRAALARCADVALLGGEATERLAAELRAAAGRLGEPMRVAVVGQIKRGKSTLVNALLGEEVSATGDFEVTYTVTELFHSAEPSLVLHFKDGREEPAPLDFFERVTTRSTEFLSLLQEIRAVAHGRPAPLLQSFRLIDTPGLASVHVTDSANTAEALGITSFGGDGSTDAALAAVGRSARAVHEDSEREIGTADAILYLFSRGLHEKDQAAVVDVAGSLAGSVSPLKAFGVLSRCDQQWPPSPELPGNPDPLTFDPLAASQDIADRYLARRDVGRLFYTVVPIAGLVGSGAQTLPEDAFNGLAELAALEPRVLVRRLRDAGRFATRAELADVKLPVEHRRLLERRLSVWGILRAAGYLRDGLGAHEVRQQLLADSGVLGLRTLITEHFGNRSSLIKLDHFHRRITAEIGAARLAAQRAGTAPPPQIGEIASRVELLRQREHGFAELAVLGAYYRGEVGFDAGEVADLLRVTGEHGVGCAARLGAPPDAGTAELEKAAQARIDAWARREQDPMLDGRTAQAARTVRRSYERVAHRVRRAAALLETGEDIDAEVLL